MCRILLHPETHDCTVDTAAVAVAELSHKICRKIQILCNGWLFFSSDKSFNLKQSLS